MVAGTSSATRMAQHPMKHLRRDVAQFVKIGTVVAVGGARWG